MKKIFVLILTVILCLSSAAFAEAQVQSEILSSTRCNPPV